MVTQQQCYVSEGSDSEIVDCCNHRSAQLRCGSTNPFTTLQTCSKKNNGVIERSDNAAVSAGFTPSLQSNFTVDHSNELSNLSTNGSNIHRHTHKKKHDNHLAVKIITPIVTCVVLLTALYFLYRFWKRRQEKMKEEEENESSAMEMGDMARREEQTQSNTKLPTTTTMGILSRKDSTGRTAFTRPRRAPFPPPASPPPDRPLPPLPAWVPRPLTATGAGRSTEIPPQWPLTDGVNVSRPATSGASGPRHTPR
ncbi:hypothetical protein F5Y01DRAFT_321529 [Xylaria sp. FL0043]|nr:hypothetical protein F5Y01DRAFT_321529 [Xylaria sp. FL0043]